MGLRRAYIDYIEESVAATLGGVQGRRMLELGNQRIRRSQRIPERTGKAYFSNRGAEHTSLDFNGKDGAVALDLGQLHDLPEWQGRFDIITNCGTTEHVEPFAAQYTCFTNLHNWLKAGGIMVHIVPGAEELNTTGRWRGHCNNYYSQRFFEVLAELNGYELVSNRVVNGLRAACLRKREDRPFTTARDALLQHITRKEGGIVYYGVNDPERRRLKNVIRVLLRKWGLVR